MRILITGNLGYVGPVLVRQLQRSRTSIELAGLDAGFFAGSLTYRGPLPEVRLQTQRFSDLRDIGPSDFENVDAVVHLAALSNDPMGSHFESLTSQINETASIRTAQLAKAAGVRAFVFASSCSVYGTGSDQPRTEADPVEPLTAYARSKIAVEKALGVLSSPDFRVTALRFATACGMSERLRLDLVLNDFVATAVTTGKIQVLSDGSPFRPLIHVEDMARAIDWAIDRTSGDNYEVINTGSNAWNYTIRELAQATADFIGGVNVHINKEAAPDKRSYRVDFTRFNDLAPARYQPQWSLSQTIDDLLSGLHAFSFADKDFRNGPYIRLKLLSTLRDKGWLDSNLRWSTSAQQPVPWKL